MVWDLLRTKKEKPAAGKTGYWRTFWRRRWDSNPRTLADQTISSRSRYDHFDTSPYLSQHQHLRKRGELMGRTSKNIKLRIPEKPRKIKGFRSRSYRVATTISSAARYDHFDTLPCDNYSILGTGNMISSQARYDHFDTPPYSLVKPAVAPIQFTGQENMRY